MPRLGWAPSPQKGRRVCPFNVFPDAACQAPPQRTAAAGPSPWRSGRGAPPLAQHPSSPFPFCRTLPAALAQ